MSRHLAIAMDFSPQSRHALQWALENLLREGDYLDIIHCMEVGTVPPVAFDFSAGTLFSDMKKSAAKVSAKNIEELASTLEEKKLPYVVHLLEGDTKEQLLAITDTLKPAVIVMGSRGLGALKRTFLGSVSDFCVHHCNCPVVIVKMPDEESTIAKHEA